MTVVAFPQTLAPAGSHLRLGLVAAAIRELGEPATIAEIAALLALAQAPAPSVAHVAALFARDAGQPPGERLFRPVRLGDQTAWAFTRAFRAFLDQEGFHPIMRRLEALAALERPGH